MAERTLRVLHAPTVVGGNAIQLAKAERSHGVESRVVSLFPSSYRYEGEYEQVRTEIGGELRRWRTLWAAITWADVIHFNFGRSLLPSRKHLQNHRFSGRFVRQVYNLYARLLEGRDLASLSRHRKAIVVTFQGSDARMPSRLSAAHPARLAYGDEPHGDDRLRSEMLEKWDRYADTIYALNPDLLQYLPARAKFQAYASVDPWLAELAAWPVREPLRLAHAPTNRRLKGTRFLQEAVASLQAEGLSIELDIVEKVPHGEALRRYSAAHIGVDQLLIGWYGALAVELMAMGRPVCGFIDSSDLHRIPSAMADELPIVRASWNTVADVIRGIHDTPRDQLRVLGVAARSFAARWHDPADIAESAICDYERILATHPSRRRKVRVP